MGNMQKKYKLTNCVYSSDHKLSSVVRCSSDRTQVVSKTGSILLLHQHYCHTLDM